MIAIVDDDSLYTDGIEFLSACLFKYHRKNTIILIDEYDVPLEDDGYQEILKYAICFFKKGCIMRKEE